MPLFTEVITISLLRVFQFLHNDNRYFLIIKAMREIFSQKYRKVRLNSN